MAGPSTGALINNVSYTHQGMVDLIVSTPMISQGDIARTFGYTEGWVSQVIRSDSFQQALAERKEALVDPVLKAALEDRLNALAHRSLDVLMDQLDLKGSPDVALKALELSTRAKGYGVGAGGLHLTQNFVVAMPPKAEDATAWAAEHKPQPAFKPAARSMAVLTVDTAIDG